MLRGRRSTEREFRLGSMEFEQPALTEDHAQSDRTLSHENHGVESQVSTKGKASGHSQRPNDLENGHAQEPKDIENGSANEKEGEKGESPEPVGFWHKSLKETRLDVFKNYIFILALLCTFILGVLSMYWGSLYNADMNLNSFVVYIINFETDPNAIIGPALVKLSEQIVAENKLPHLGYVTVDPSTLGNDPINVRQAVYDNEAWAAMIVNSNATRLLRSAVETGNASYDPLGACQLIYQDGRDQESIYDYILPQLSQLQTQFTAMAGEQWVKTVLSNSSISRENLQKVPQALSPAIGFSTYNLRPFYPQQATPAVTVGLIYLIILSFFAFSFFMPIHMKFTSPGHPPLKVWQLWIWRYIAAINSYFFLSLAYSLVSLAFQIPFSHAPAAETVVATDANPFNKGTFVIYWMLNFVGMTALGMACENVAMVVGFPWTAMWLIFWVITNVCTSFYPLELEPAFYRWGYAWPLHNIVEGSRTLIFGVYSQLGLNFGILFAWAGVGTVLFPFCSWFMQWKQEREKKKGD